MLTISLSPLPTPLAAQDDWSIERPRATKRSDRAKPAAKRSKTATQGRTPTTAPVQEPRASEGSRQNVIAERYRELLERDPFHTHAVRRLFEITRAQEGGLEPLQARLMAVSPEDRTYAQTALGGHVAHELGQLDAAREAYERAAALEPKAAGPWRALAALARENGDLDAARQALEAALARSPKRAGNEDLRALAELALDAGNLDAAREHYAALGRQQPSSIHQATELPRALAERGQHTEAAAEYAKAIERLHGDARVLAPLLVEQARAQLAAGDATAALTTLERARRGAATQSGVRGEIDALELAVHRENGTLAELSQRLAKSAGDFASLDRLARVYEELGDQAQAQQTLRRALKLQPRAIEARERLARILMREGRLDEVVAEFRALMRAAPREPRFVIELGRLLAQTGRRDEALKLLDDVARRFAGQARMHRSLAELLAEWGEQARAADQIEALQRLEPREPMHLITLGEHHFVHDDKDEAIALWKRIPRIASDRAEGHTLLADVYLDHDMPEEAVEELQQALRLAPERIDTLRGLARALERLNDRREAMEAWQKVLALSKPDQRTQRREARRALVRLWMEAGSLRRRVAQYEAAFGWSLDAGMTQTPRAPDIEAGRMLADAYELMGRGLRGIARDTRPLRAAEDVLARLVSLRPGDVESLLGLQRLREGRGDVEGAIDVLERLVKADPQNARGYLARMATHALSLYRDDDAIAYAERSVALSPNDARAHERLGNLYRARQRNDDAIAAYERAIAIDVTSFGAQFAIAELYLARGDGASAEAALRQVLLRAADDVLVQRATRSAIQIAMGSGQTNALEADLFALALRGERPVHRRLLLELYDALAQAPIASVDAPGKRGAEARATLAAIGKRGIKPLLEALSDDDEAQRAIAIRLLGHVGNSAATRPLLTAAQAEGDIALRRQALVAAARVATPAAVEQLAAFAARPERRLSDVGAWALAHVGGHAAVTEMRARLTSPSPYVRGLALLGLARADDRASIEAAHRMLQHEPHAWARGAAAVALGWLGDESAREPLQRALRSEQSSVAAAAAAALGRLGSQDAAPALAAAVFSLDPPVAHAAAHALARIGVNGPIDAACELPSPERGWTSEALVAAALGPTPDDAPRAIEQHMPELQRAARDALAGTRASIEVSLAMLATARPPLLTDPDAARAAANALATRLTPELTELLDHREGAIRAAALRLLAVLGGPTGTDATLRGLTDPDLRVREAALDVAVRVPAPTLAAALAQIARREPRWWVRRKAVQALGRVRGEASVSALLAVLEHDRYAFVREAAATALGTLGAGHEALNRAQSGDPDATVRAAAARAAHVGQRPHSPAH